MSLVSREPGRVMVGGLRSKVGGLKSKVGGLRSKVGGVVRCHCPERSMVVRIAVSAVCAVIVMAQERQTSDKTMLRMNVILFVDFLLFTCLGSAKLRKIYGQPNKIYIFFEYLRVSAHFYNFTRINGIC